MASAPHLLIDRAMVADAVPKRSTRRGLSGIMVI
jgi:hypothetical protein